MMNIMCGLRALHEYYTPLRTHLHAYTKKVAGLSARNPNRTSEYPRLDVDGIRLSKRIVEERLQCLCLSDSQRKRGLRDAVLAILLWVRCDGDDVGTGLLGGVVAAHVEGKSGSGLLAVILAVAHRRFLLV